MEKTISEWLELLPTWIKIEAEKNIRGQYKHLKFDSLEEAISSAFVWKDTPQGHQFWSNVSHGYFNIEPNTDADS